MSLFAFRPIHLGRRPWIIALALVRPGVVDGETVEGFIEPNQRIEISSASDPATVKEIFVREGDHVQPGELMATLNTSVLEASLVIAQKRAAMHGRLEAAQAELDLRADRLHKLMRLRSEGHASPAELERAKADHAVAKAQWELTKEELELAKLECHLIEAQIQERRFESPIQGLVVEVLREPGEITSLGDPRLLTVVQLDPLRVKFPVSVRAALGLKAGAAVTLELPEIEATCAAVIEVVSPVLDPKSGTVQVSCLVQNAEGKFRSGMRCLLRLDEPDDVDDDESIASE